MNACGSSTFFFQLSFIRCEFNFDDFDSTRTEQMDELRVEYLQRRLDKRRAFIREQLEEIRQRRERQGQNSQNDRKEEGTPVSAA